MYPSLFKGCLVIAPIAAVVALGNAAGAANIILEANSQGWYRSAGDSLNDGLSNGLPNFVANTFTGSFNGTEHRSYFSFDIGGVQSTVTDITFRLFSDFYFSGDSGETVTVYDVETPTSVLTSRPEQAIATSIFEDLGTGSTYGVTTVATRKPGWTPLDGTLEIPLAPTAVEHFTQAQMCKNSFSLGLALTSLGGTEVFNAEGVRFSDTLLDPAAQLVITLEDSTASASGGSSDCTQDPDFTSPPSDAVSVAEPSNLIGVLAILGIGLTSRRLTGQRY